MEFRKNLFRIFADSRFLLCFGLRRLETDGWSYISFTGGIRMRWDVLQRIVGTYMVLLRELFTPEKIICFFSAVWLTKRFFPNDQRSLRKRTKSRKLLKESR